MADNAVTIITEGRSLRALPFRTTADQLSTGKTWEDWLESIEREFRYFRITNPTDRKDALIIYGGAEIARLEKSLPDEDPERDLDEYQILKNKLNAYFLPKKNKHYAEETYASSEMSSDDEFLEKSVTHLRIKTVNESVEENRVLSQEIALLQGKVRELENELRLAKQLIQSALKQQSVEKSYPKERIEEIETFQTNTLNETNKKTNGVLFDMPVANLTDLKVSQTADEVKTEEHQKLCSEELQTRDRKSVV